MTVVIADSSPLNYLTLIGSIEVLHRLYGAVIVPRQVIGELIDPAAPQDVRKWASDLPKWIDLRETVVNDEGMTHLDPGERAAIVLAQIGAWRFALDRRDGRPARSVATGHSKHGDTRRVAGSLPQGLLDLPTALARLLETNFHVSMELVTALLAEDADRRRPAE